MRITFLLRKQNNPNLSLFSYGSSKSAFTSTVENQMHNNKTGKNKELI